MDFHYIRPSKVLYCHHHGYDERKPSFVFITSLPPAGGAKARYLCRRLRALVPTTSVTVLRPAMESQDPARSSAALREAGADAVISSMSAAQSACDRWRLSAGRGAAHRFADLRNLVLPLVPSLGDMGLVEPGRIGAGRHDVRRSEVGHRQVIARLHGGKIAGLADGGPLIEFARVIREAGIVLHAP